MIKHFKWFYCCFNAYASYLFNNLKWHYPHADEIRLSSFREFASRVVLAHSVTYFPFLGRLGIFTISLRWLSFFTRHTQVAIVSPFTLQPQVVQLVHPSALYHSNLSHCSLGSFKMFTRYPWIVQLVHPLPPDSLTFHPAADRSTFSPNTLDWIAKLDHPSTSDSSTSSPFSLWPFNVFTLSTLDHSTFSLFNLRLFNLFTLKTARTRIVLLFHPAALNRLSFSPGSLGSLNFLTRQPQIVQLVYYSASDCSTLSTVSLRSSSFFTVSPRSLNLFTFQLYLVLIS